MSFGRYEILDPIAAGGMGEVFRARAYGEDGFVKQIALKRILPALSADPAFLALFVEEARTAVSLTHGNLVQVLDFGRIDGGYFLAMEWVDGGDLAQLLHAGPLPQEIALFVAAEILQGLDYAHRAGVLHRDLKPSNVLVSFEGEVKVTDFGIARAARGTRGSDGMGTPLYMSPEQMMGADLDPRSDLFAWGLIVHEMFTGKPAFGGLAQAELTVAVAAAAVPPLSLDPALGALVASALARDRRERPASAGVLLERIQQYALDRRFPLAGRPLARLAGERIRRRSVRKSDPDASTIIRVDTADSLPSFRTLMSESPPVVPVWRRWARRAGVLLASLLLGLVLLAVFAPVGVWASWVVRRLTTYGPNGQNWKPIHDAAETGDVDQLRRLVDSGVPVDLRTNSGITALGIATRVGSLPAVRFLLSRGAAAGAQDDEGRTPLHVAAEWDRTDVMRILLAAGAPVDTPMRKQIRPLWLVGEQVDDPEAAKLLLMNGAVVDAPTEDGTTALHEAVFGDRLRLAGALLAFGADPDRHAATPAELGPPDLRIDGMSPRELARKLGDSRMVELLERPRQQVKR